MTRIVLKGGLVHDVLRKKRFKADLLIEGRLIKRLGELSATEADEVIDCEGKWIFPGLFDMHVHFRDPGREDEETVETGIRAAINGGVLYACCMPNTEPPIDNEFVLGYVLDKAKRVCPGFKLFVAACITAGREGRQLSEAGILSEAGASAFSDDGSPVMDSYLMRRAMEYISMFDKPLILHEEDLLLSNGGVMHEGYYSAILGLRGIPYVSELTMLQRDLTLAQLTGARVHFTHLSCKESIQFLRRFAADFPRVSFDVAFHHLIFCDADLVDYDANLKLNPPLRSQDDRRELIESVKKGEPLAIVSDHAPHAAHEKELEFERAPFGACGVELMLVALLSELVLKGVCDVFDILVPLTIGPSRFFGMEIPLLSEGDDATLVVVNPQKKTLVTRENLCSKSSNTPFIGRMLNSSVEDVFIAGQAVKRNGRVLI